MDAFTYLQDHWVFIAGLVSLIVWSARLEFQVKQNSKTLADHLNMDRTNIDKVHTDLMTLQGKVDKLSRDLNQLIGAFNATQGRKGINDI